MNTLANLLEQTQANLAQAEARIAALETQLAQAIQLPDISERIFRHMTDYSKDVFSLVNDKGDIEYVSPSIERVLGYTIDEGIFLGVSGLVHLDDLTQVNNILQELISVPGEQCTFVIRCKHKDGRWLWFEVTAANHLQNPELHAILVNGRDITERKYVEDALQDSENRLQAIFDYSMDAILLTIPDGRILKANAAASRMFGYSEAEFIERGRSGIVDRNDPRIQIAVERRRITNQFSGELTFVRSDGTPFPGEISTAIFKDAHGNDFSTMIIRDITERKRAEEALRLSEEQYRSLFQNAQVGMYRSRIDGSAMLAVNQELADMFGYTIEELILEPTVIHWAEPTARAQMLRQLQEKGWLNNYELDLVTKSGEVRTVLASIKLYPQDGYLEGSLVDISERKWAEKRSHLQLAAMESTANGIVIMGVTGSIEWVNPAFSTMTGYSKEESLGRNLSELVRSGLHEQSYYEDMWNTVLAGQVWHGEIINRRKDGSLYTEEQTITPVLTTDGKVSHFIGIKQDITERKQVEVKLHRLNRTLAVVNQINQATIRIRSIPMLFQEVCRIAVEIGGLHMVWIGLLDPRTTQMVPIGSAGVTGDYLEHLDIRMNDAVRSGGPNGTVVRTGKHYIVSDIEHDPLIAPWRERALQIGYRTSAGFPLFVAGKVCGTLNLYANQSNFFDDDEIKLIDEVAANLSFAMEFAEQETQRRLAEEAEREQRLFAEALRDSLAALTSSLDVDTVMQQILASSATVIPCEAGTIIFYEDNHGRVAYSRGYSDEAIKYFKQTSIPFESGLFVKDTSRESFYLAADTQSTPDWVSFPYTDWVRSSIGVSMLLHGKPIGMLIADSGTPNRFQQEDVEKLQVFARYTALALENAFQAAQLEHKIAERTAELNAAKQRAEAILNSGTDAILLVHNDFTIQQTNTSFNSMFGCEQDDCFGKSITVLLSPNNDDVIAKLVQAATARNKLVIDVEALRKDGTVFAAEISLGFITANSFVCTFHDINERKALEQSLLAAVHKEKELNELKTRFVSMASHEFRTPLATIRATTETLTAYRHRLSDEQIEQKLIKTTEQIDFLTDIMDDVLQLARLQTRHFEYKPSKLDLNTLWREILDEYQSRQDIHHKFNYSSGTNIPSIQADKKLMRQIITNLLSNAVKYSFPDKAITITLEHVDNWVCFSVQDEGIGIPEDDLSHLFESFHRAQNVGTIHGTGLGLVIAKDAVELHGGTITVVSKVGLGTTFTVQIPVAD